MDSESSRTIARVPGVSLPVTLVDHARDAAACVAAEIASLLAGPRPVTLGLATGRSPRELYRELVRRHREEGLSFARATSFNLDEYHGLAPDHPASFHAAMRAMLLDHVDLAPERAHLPDGTLPLNAVEAACAAYERAIEAAGGIDLQILGIGPNGHLAFNEPGSARGSRTRLVELAEETRRANRPAFPPGEEVPARAITMGVATILEARRLRVMAFGGGKAAIVRRALLEPVGPACPATFLREHPDVELWLDRAAAAELPAAG